MIITLLVFWLVSSILMLWFLCNLGNKHNENSLVCMYKVLTDQYLGCTDERLWLVGISLLLGWLVVPYLLFNLLFWIPLSERHSEKRAAEAYAAKVEANRERIITEFLSKK